MKLITTIVSSSDADNLVNTLIQNGYQVTKLGSTGGFLRRGNATILIGVEDERLDGVLSAIRYTCHARTELVLPPPLLTPGAGYAPGPIEVRVGGAVIFVQEVEHFERT